MALPVVAEATTLDATSHFRDLYVENVRAPLIELAEQLGLNALEKLIGARVPQPACPVPLGEAERFCLLAHAFTHVMLTMLSQMVWGSKVPTDKLVPAFAFKRQVCMYCALPSTGADELGVLHVPKHCWQQRYMSVSCMSA